MSKEKARSGGSLGPENQHIAGLRGTHLSGKLSRTFVEKLQRQLHRKLGPFANQAFNPNATLMLFDNLTANA